MKSYDLIVIGGGAGGLTAAHWGASFGAKVCLIDREKLGGDCLYSGCVPSKTLIKTAAVAHLVQHADRYGVHAQKPVIDFHKVMERVRHVITEVEKNDSPDALRSTGIDVIFGTSKFVDENALRVDLNRSLFKLQQPEFAERSDGVTLEAKRFIIATGSRPQIPPIEGLSDVGFLTNREIFSLQKQPRTLLVVGGGPIGCEMAQAFARLGTKVTMVLRSDLILQREDSDVSQYMMEKFTAEGIEIVTNVQFEKFIKTDIGNKTLHYKKDGVSRQLKVEEILIATGRQPNIEDLGLEKANIEFTPAGITVDAHMRTSNKRIYAVGDVNGKSLFTHAAGYEAAVAVTNAIVHYPISIDFNKIPWTTFTDPEVAHCGLTEREAREKDIDVEVWKVPMSKVDRAHTESETDGFLKILTQGKKGKIVGAHLVAQHAGDLIHELLLAQSKGLSIEDLATLVHVYPTRSEIVRHCAAQWYERKIFSPGIKKWLKRFFGYRGA